MRTLTDNQIGELISMYENNAESLKALRNALDEGLDIESGIQDAEDSFEQGFNNALEKVFDVLGVDVSEKNVEDEIPEGGIILYDYLARKEEDFDTISAGFAPIITVCHIDEEHDEHDKFCNAIYKKVKVFKASTDINGYSILLVDWVDLIRRNKDAFKAFMEKFWTNSFYDEQVFIHEWLGEMHQYFAGNVPMSIYKKLLNLADEIK